MRRSILPIALVLALATGAALGQARGLLSPAAVSDDAALGTRIEVVRRFYAAADAALDSGDTRELERTVAPQFVDHTRRLAIDSSRGGLVRYLASLRAAFSAVNLVPLDLVAQHDRVVARFGVDGAGGGNFLGLPVSGDDIWSGIDIFRVEGGLIAEHWSDQGDRFLLEPLVETSFTSDGTTGNVVTMERRSYAADAALQEAMAAGPALLFIESGALTGELDFRSPAAATLLQHSTSGQTARSDVPPGGSTTLMTGDTLALHTDTVLKTRNDERVPTRVIVVTIGRSHPPETAPEARSVVATPGITDGILA
ncbi:MAG TPA: ester cyclase, partial [Thermomicrobiales bacterium]